MGVTYVYSKNDPENKIYLESFENKKEHEILYTTFKKYVKDLKIEALDTTVSICGIQKEYTRNTNFHPNSE